MGKTELLFKNSINTPKQFCSSPVILYDIDLISDNLLHHKTNMQRKKFYFYKHFQSNHTRSKAVSYLEPEQVECGDYHALLLLRRGPV